MSTAGISTVAVVGAGTMGAGIAGELARAGCVVRLVDTTREEGERGLERLQAAQVALVGWGQLSPSRADEALSRVHVTCELGRACAGVELVVESIHEDLESKRALFLQLDRLCASATILATNTSGLSVSDIAAATRTPERVAGLHFWNPPHLIPLVEVVKGARTSEPTLQTLHNLALALGKRPIVVRRDIPGFVGNRLQFAVLREALHLLSEGVASAEEIDAAMTAGPGLRYALIGPFQTADLGGLDVFKAIADYLFAELSTSTRAQEVLRRKVAGGELGVKSGMGFYDYSGGGAGSMVETTERRLMALLETVARGASTREDRKQGGEDG